MAHATKLPEILLASISPRRKQLLEALTIPFRVEKPDAEEITPNVSDIRAGILRNATAKAHSVLRNVSDSDVIVVSADTLVMVQNRILGKPADANEARDMLQLQSGQTQTVLTGIVLSSKRFGERSAIEETRVTFKKIAAAEIEDYVNTREPYDKAGAYAVQGLGALFIDKIEGSYTNVMGFPLERFLRELSLLTQISAFDWFRK